MHAEEAANLADGLARELFVKKIVRGMDKSAFQAVEACIFQYLKRVYGPDSWKNY